MISHKIVIKITVSAHDTIMIECEGVANCTNIQFC